jgi:VanZ family protein
MKIFLSRWLPVLLWAALIFLVSADQNPYLFLPTTMRQPVQVAGITLSVDELFGIPGHLSEYAILGVLTTRALIWQHKPNQKLFAIAIALCAAYALSDEIHQLFVPGRAFQIQDLVIDSAGILIGITLYWAIRFNPNRHLKVSEI